MYIFSARSGDIASFKKSSSYDGLDETCDILVSLNIVLGDKVGHQRRGESVDEEVGNEDRSTVE